MLNPFIDLISMVIHLIELGLIIWIVLNLLIQFNVVNGFQPLVARIRFSLDRLFNPMLRPIRKYMPDLGGFDLSPIVLILLLRFINSALFHWLYDL